MAITADDLLLGLKDRGIVPSNQSQLQDNRFLAMADRIVEIRIVPLLESCDQEFFVTTASVTINAGQSLYAIPYRSIGRGIRDLKMQDASGNIRNLVKIAIEDAHAYATSGDTIGFYFLGDQVRLVPDVPATLSQGLSLLFYFRMPPNKLCASSSAALVLSATATDVVVSSVPTNLVNGVSVDFIQGKSGCSIYNIDKTLNSIAGTTLSFTSGDVPMTAPSVLTAGDYVCLAGTSPVLNFVPNEMFSYLESLLTERVLYAVGDSTGAKDLKDTIKEEKENLLKILDPRIDGEPTIIINRSSLVRGNKFIQRSWLYGS